MNMIPKVRSDTPSAIIQFQSVSCSAVPKQKLHPRRVHLEISVRADRLSIGYVAVQNMGAEDDFLIAREATCCDLSPGPRRLTEGRIEQRLEYTEVRIQESGSRMLWSGHVPFEELFFGSAEQL